MKICRYDPGVKHGDTGVQTVAVPDTEPVTMLLLLLSLLLLVTGVGIAQHHHSQYVHQRWETFGTFVCKYLDISKCSVSKCKYSAMLICICCGC